MVQSMYFSASDLRNFHELNKDIFEEKNIIISDGLVVSLELNSNLSKD